jgi:REP element-mobilizing transposase RayT
MGQMALPGVRKRPSKNGGRWGGRRAGAGRKPTGPKAGTSHARRPAPSVKRPMHLTVRLTPGLRRLRRRRGYQMVRRAIGAANRFGGAWICEVSIQHNHIHLIAETTNQAALTKMMRSFGNSLAKSVNGDASRRGAVVGDRYHAVILRTPSQVKAALAYVLGNWRRHAEDLRLQGPRRLADRYSTGPCFTGWDTGPPSGQLPFPDDGPLPVSPARSWLLRVGWRTCGLISPWTRPGPVARR